MSPFSHTSVKPLNIYDHDYKDEGVSNSPSGLSNLIYGGEESIIT